jgi:hypothetical protein
MSAWGLARRELNCTFFKKEGPMQIVALLLAGIMIGVALYPFICFVFKFLKTRPSGYATTLNCMDGAVQGAARKYMKNRYGVAYVDPITDPGIVKILTDDSGDEEAEVIRRWIHKKLRISIISHGSRKISIAAHHNCIGNPKCKEAQIKQLKEAKKTVERMIAEFELDIEIILLWINKDHMPEEILDSQEETSNLQKATA